MGGHLLCAPWRRRCVCLLGDGFRMGCVFMLCDWQIDHHVDHHVDHNVDHIHQPAVDHNVESK